MASIAQLVEQPPCKRQVVGSSPTAGSIPGRFTPEKRGLTRAF